MTAGNPAGEALQQPGRIVVKVGSALLSDHLISLDALTKDVLVLAEETRIGDACFVTSGAVALGREGLEEIPSVATLDERQALSAVGQISLMTSWRAALDRHGKIAAQILLTPDVTSDRQRYLNARRKFRTLLAHGAVPVVNENDAIATEELRYGDNDRLAAMTAGLIGATTLVLLTDVPGLFTANPATDPDARPIAELSADEALDWDRAGLAPTTDAGTGGMASKLDAAAMAAAWGIDVVIASGKEPAPLSAIINGTTTATLVRGAADAIPARRIWLAGLREHEASASIKVDAGAVQALRDGNSLLSVGVVDVQGHFDTGDIVAVLDDKGAPLGIGIAKAPNEAIQDRTAKLAIHRDDFVLTLVP